MPHPIKVVPKLTLTEWKPRVGESPTGRHFEVMKVENSLNWAIGSIVSERDISARLLTGTIRTTLIRKKSYPPK